jgi:predicted alpha/beta superfamily hydrolase
MKSLKLITFFLFGTLSVFPQVGNTSNDTISPIRIGYTIKLNSIVLNEIRAIYIYLPDNYKKNHNSYPVLYLLDAETNFKPVCGVVDILSRWKIIPELIVVGLPNTDRMRDLTPTLDRKFKIGGGGNNFLGFLKEELVPYIDQNYNTNLSEY